MTRTTITVERYCDGCHQPVRDATQEELEWAVAGLPLPSVVAEHGCQDSPDEQGDDMDDAITEVRFWQLVQAEERRTIVCNPDLESRLKGYIAARGQQHRLTVKPSPVCPTNRVFVIDEGAIEAGLNEAVSGSKRWPLG